MIRKPSYNFSRMSQCHVVYRCITRCLSAVLLVLMADSAMAGTELTALALDRFQIEPGTEQRFEEQGLPISDGFITTEIEHLAALCTVWYFRDQAAPVLRARQFRGPSIELMLLRIEVEAGDNFLVSFSDWPSDDMSFNFYSENAEGLQHIGSVYGTEILVANWPFVYVSGHVNNAVHETKLIKLTREEIAESSHHITYIGKSSRTRHPVDLYTTSDKDSRELVARVPAGVALELLVRRANANIDPEELCMFVKTESGMIGWICLEESKLTEESSPLDSVYFRGD
jgi:hypothetical protein